MSNNDLLNAQERLYFGEIQDIDKNLKAYIKAQKEYYISKQIDDEIER